MRDTTDGPIKMSSSSCVLQLLLSWCLLELRLMFVSLMKYCCFFVVVVVMLSAHKLSDALFLCIGRNTSRNRKQKTETEPHFSFILLIILLK